MMPPSSQQTHPDIVSFANHTSDSALHQGEHEESENSESLGKNDEQINQEALYAYYNTSGAHVHP